MRKNEVVHRNNPKLMQLERKDGYTSLYLEYYLGRTQTPVLDGSGNQVRYERGKCEGKPKYKVVHYRKKESMGFKFKTKPITSDERIRKKAVLEEAERIRYEREQELLCERRGYRIKTKVLDYIAYFQEYIGNYNKKDISMMKGVLKRFISFLDDTPKYRRQCGKDFFRHDALTLNPELMTTSMMKDFADYLKARGKGDGAKSYFARFKKVAKYAVDDGVLRFNPCKDITLVADKMTLKKAILSEDEIRLLATTRYEKVSTSIRRAFLFCLHAGLRFCDVRSLTYGNVDFSNNRIRFEQSKTKERSKYSVVEIPLNDSLLTLIGKPTDKNNLNEKIFDLPSYSSCSKALSLWIEKAGIDKHITWHCARHSFASNLLDKGANIKTVAELLGHSGLECVVRYVRAREERKRMAIDSLEQFDYSYL